MLIVLLSRCFRSFIIVSRCRAFRSTPLVISKSSKPSRSTSMNIGHQAQSDAATPAKLAISENTLCPRFRNIVFRIVCGLSMNVPGTGVYCTLGIIWLFLVRRSLFSISTTMKSSKPSRLISAKSSPMENILVFLGANAGASRKRPWPTLSQRRSSPSKSLQT